MNMGKRQSGSQDKTASLFDLTLNEHSIHGGYIYIPLKYRHLLLVDLNKKLHLIHQRDDFPISWKLDSNGRLMADSSKGELKTLREWFQETDAKAGDTMRFGESDEDNLFVELILQQEIRYHRHSNKNQSLVSTSENLYSIVNTIGMRDMFKLATIGSELESILKEGMDKALNAELCTNQPIDQCVRLISHDPQLMRFFDKYWESTDFKRVFSYRPIQLIFDTGTEEEEPSKNLILIDFQTPTPVDLAQLEKIKDVQHSRLALKYNRLLEEYDQLAPAFKSLMAEFQEIPAEDNSAKAQLLSSFLDLAKDTLRKPDIHDGLADIIKDLFHDPIPMFQSLMGLFLPEGIKRAKDAMEHIAEVCRLTPEQYGKLINDLSEMKLLSNACRIHWCPYHVQDPFYSLSVLPTNRFMGTCPQCGQQLSSVGWSMINSDIFHFMRHKDGLISIAIAWYSQKNGWSWKSNQTLDGQEIDLMLQKQKNTIYIETKTLMFDNDYSALRRKILEELRKFERKRNVIKTEPGSKNYFLFVLNLPHDILATLKLRTDADVSLISIDDFKDTLEKTILAESKNKDSH